MSTGQKTELLVIGGSAGGLSMVLKVLPLLKRSSNLCVIIVFHRKADDHNVLVEVLSRRSDFEVKEVDDKDKIIPGIIYVAPADYHVLVEKNHTLTLDDSEKINYSRPSIDVTFETAAEVFGSSLACMLLSGANSDGADGMAKAKSLGSLVLIQDPDQAEVPVMRKAALDRVKADLIFNDENIEEVVRIATSKI